MYRGDITFQIIHVDALFKGMEHISHMFMLFHKYLFLEMISIFIYLKYNCSHNLSLFKNRSILPYWIWSQTGNEVLLCYCSQTFQSAILKNVKKVWCGKYIFVCILIHKILWFDLIFMNWFLNWDLFTLTWYPSTILKQNKFPLESK